MADGSSIRRMSEAARDALLKADGDWETAAQIMRERISRDKELFQELMEPLVDGAIWTEIRLAAGAQRRAFSKAARPDNASGLHLIAHRTQQRWLDKYTLPGGVKLGEADKLLVLREANRHEALAASNSIEARFLREIAKRMGDAKRVRAALSNDDIQKIREKITC